ncbi:TRAP transporter substrate-binding protein [Pararhodospirillum photometricum]|uniref:Bacterial extracellular solute-binding protein,family 7 n=1 Tax=Pararhodospirillum photometricum DSM 122 TaxID=1150469 RepID=H6SLM6_PARPM|nr:Bacterial extracellular solute-binding protein,family 7 [Pararhodospirillum photometricum DSM 122]
MLTRRTFARLAGIATLALSASVLTTMPALAEPIVIKFSHVVAPNTPKGKGAEKFKELAESYTAGAVKVEIYPNSQLYKDKEEMEALQLGAVQMLAPSLAKFGPLGVQQFELFDLPYLMKDYDDLRKITDGEVGKGLLARLEPKGIKGLAYWDNGFKVMSANSPLHTPDDFLGLKMRIQSSKILEAQMQALGAVPQVMAFSEVYQALQTGVVDGTENPPSNMFTQKMHEVQKHATVSNHGYLGYAVIVNKAFWDGLDPAIRGKLEQAMTEATVYANSIAKEENESSLAAMKAAGKTEFYELNADERAQWVKALRPVHDQMAGRIGADLIKEAYAALGTQ